MSDISCMPHLITIFEKIEDGMRKEGMSVRK
jgi:hypothetical protein